MVLNLNQIHFCAAECERQQSGEMSVYHMCNALAYFEDTWCYSHECIQEIGRLVEPIKNANGYRKTPVMIGDQILPAETVIHEMHNLINWLKRLNENSLEQDVLAVKFYLAFERVHPFIDGNGRVGAIIYNWLMDKLENPVAPPDVFKKEDQ